MIWKTRSAGAARRPEHAVVSFDSALGLRIDLCEPTKAVGVLELRDALMQPHGITHGGVYAAIAETLASEGTNAGVRADGLIALGASNQTNFLRPTSAGVLTAIAVR